MQTVPQSPAIEDYAEGLRRVADELTGRRAPARALVDRVNRLVIVDDADEVTGEILRVDGHAIAAAVTVRNGRVDGVSIASDSPAVLRAIAAHASELADRLEARRAPTCAAVSS